MTKVHAYVLSPTSDTEHSNFITKIALTAQYIEFCKLPLIQLFVSQTVKMVVNVYHQISVTAQVTMKETTAVKVKCTFRTTDVYLLMC